MRETKNGNVIGKMEYYGQRTSKFVQKLLYVGVKKNKVVVKGAL